MANHCLPELIPPAAITGRATSLTTWFTKTRVEVSSFPLCPPASKPSATIASAPQASAFWANLTLETTCTTFIPCDLSKEVKREGFPAEVKTTGTLASMTVSICFWLLEFIRGIFTPKGLSVFFLALSICTFKTSGLILPAPISPNPP